ncbi:hypothetical protein K438DRAFT_1776654 [Mycena galopus ATCC 62051]|nr:hypothetical protein K438DRAFT_1776654 [Mycena galopus ATCC 62051]
MSSRSQAIKPQDQVPYFLSKPIVDQDPRIILNSFDLPNIILLRARPQALGPRGQALGFAGQARPGVGLEQAQALGLIEFGLRVEKPETHNLFALDSGPGLGRGLGLEALLAGLGLGLKNLKPRPAQARPRPGPPGQAGP